MIHRVQAVNQAVNAENKIHEDEVARRYGFGGGLVPGVTVFAYMTYPVVARYGLEWFGRGTMSVRFDRPVYDGDSVEVAAREEEGGLAVTVTTAGGRCAGARAGLAEASALPPLSDRYPLAPLPSQRPPAGESTLASGTVMGTVLLPVEAAAEAAYRAEVGEDLPIYSADRLLHPGQLLQGCNRLLFENVLLGPWIHTGSELRMFGPAREGETVALRGWVSDRFDRKGHRFVVLDILALAGARPIMHCLHTAIWEPRPVGGEARKPSS